MIRPICNLLIFGAALVSILTIAGAQENQIKKNQACRIPLTAPGRCPSGARSLIR
jgi:hypothetical protein